MTAFQKYQAWMQRSREPALLTPLLRYWLGLALLMTCAHAGINTHHLFHETSLVISLPLIVIFTSTSLILPAVIFQRLIGDLNLGQGAPSFYVPNLIRSAVMGGTYGWMASFSFKEFELLSLIKLPFAILAVGLIFELTIGRLPFFKPASINKILTLESAA